MTEHESKPQKARIEGGLDAIVIGGAPDGLVAAAYLARAGMKTILLEATAEVGAPYRRAGEGVDMSMLDGEHLFHTLDPQMIDDLDLYGCGVSYAARRMGTAYFFEDEEPLRFGGDLRAAAVDAGTDADGLERFIGDIFEAASFLRPLVAGAPGANASFGAALKIASPAYADKLHQLLTKPADTVLDAYFAEGRVRTAMLSEAAFKNGVAPYEPMSFSSLLTRWCGEISGLQGAVAFAEGGPGAVIDALRRAAQKAGVEFRTLSPIKRILIENDRAAGVELQTGNQLRAPIVVSAIDAQRTFIKQIGPAMLDRGFQQAVSMTKPPFTAAHLQLTLKDDPFGANAEADLARRIVYAPAPEKLRKAFMAAGQGKVPEELIVEAVCFNAFMDNAAPERNRLSMLAYPAPNIVLDDTLKQNLQSAILAAADQFAPGISDRVEASRLVTSGDLAAVSGAPVSAFASCEGLYRQMARAAYATAAGAIEGLYFCGPEAQIGYGINGAAGRNAAQAALHKGMRAGAAA